MRKTLSGVIIAVVAAAGGALIATWATPLVGSGAGRLSRAARGGRPSGSERHLAGDERSANYDIQTHMARPALALRPGPYGPVPAAAGARARRGRLGAAGHGHRRRRRDSVQAGGARARRKKNQENWLTRDPEIKCYLPGVPRATYMPYPFQILPEHEAIFFAYEYAGASRNVYLKDPGPAPVDSWMGQSVGKWEGETLVIDVTGFNDQTWFDRAGNFHSEELHVVERYTRTGAGRHQLRSDDRRSEDVHAAVEDQHAALSPRREERAADGLQVRRVRRRADVRPVAQEAAAAISSEMQRCTRIDMHRGRRRSVRVAVAAAGRRAIGPARRAAPTGGSAAAQAAAIPRTPTAIPICRASTTSRR